MCWGWPGLSPRSRCTVSAAGSRSSAAATRSPSCAAISPLRSAGRKAAPTGCARWRRAGSCRRRAGISTLLPSVTAPRRALATGSRPRTAARCCPSVWPRSGCRPGPSAPRSPAARASCSPTAGGSRRRWCRGRAAAAPSSQLSATRRRPKRSSKRCAAPTCSSSRRRFLSATPRWRASAGTSRRPRRPGWPAPPGSARWSSTTSPAATRPRRLPRKPPRSSPRPGSPPISTASWSRPGRRGARVEPGRIALSTGAAVAATIRLSRKEPEMAADENPALIPVTVLTGFLGSGKTSVLNHVLKRPGMAATAVIINEFGEIGLDHLLVEIAETLLDLFGKRRRGEIPQFRRAVIETTGLADPAPILHTLMTDPLVAARYVLDGVVTTIDAANGERTLECQPEAVKQAAVAGRLLLTKTDLATATAIARLRARLAALNPAAPILPVAHGAVAPEGLFGLGLYDPQTKSLEVRRWLREEAFAAADEAAHGHHHDAERHDARIHAFCITRERPISWAVLSSWLDALAEMRGDDLLRLKAIVALRERPDEPVVLHGVQHVFHPPVLLREWPDADRRTRMVFITRDLPREVIERTLAACEEAAGEAG